MAPTVIAQKDQTDQTDDKQATPKKKVSSPLAKSSRLTFSRLLSRVQSILLRRRRHCLGTEMMEKGEELRNVSQVHAYLADH